MNANPREYKGSSLLTFPTDYTVIDVETTGVDPHWDEIIEMAAIRVRNGDAIDRFSTLVRPNNPISDFISKLTGITNEAVATAPRLPDVLGGFLDFLGNDIIVGHNVHFDVNFIYDASMAEFGKPITNDMVDTLRLSRRLLPDLPHHRLEDVASAFNVDQVCAHRSLADCETTYLVLRELASKATANGTTFENGTHHHAPLKASSITARDGLVQPDHPLYGKVCVFTGALEKMLRRDAMQLVTDIGGICGDSVTSKTNFLILGNNDYCASIKDGKSTKQKKAEKYILNGADLTIISENTFYDMLSENQETKSFPLDDTTYSSVSIEKTDIPHDGAELTEMENNFVIKVSKILQNSPAHSKLVLERRSDNYLSLVLGSNDFLRFKYSKRAKWISLDLPLNLREYNQHNSIFDAQKNKGQRHWKALISSLDDLDAMADLIIASCVDFYSVGNMWSEQ